MSVQILPLQNLKDLGLTPEQMIPAYGGESAGLDLYNAGPTLFIRPSTSYDLSLNTEAYFKATFKTLMPTGIKVAIPQGHVGLIVERSSITKTALKVRAGVIDPGYTGEVFVNCINTSGKEAVLVAGEKSPFQLLVLRCDNGFCLTDEAGYAASTETSKRQAGAIGSSDKVQ